MYFLCVSSSLFSLLRLVFAEGNECEEYMNRLEDFRGRETRLFLLMTIHSASSWKRHFLSFVFFRFHDTRHRRHLNFCSNLST